MWAPGMHSVCREAKYETARALQTLSSQSLFALLTQPHLYHTQQVERLASGLSHQPRVVVARLNALGSSEAFMFSTGALEVKQYPTIFLYPEGSPGYMRFTGAEA